VEDLILLFVARHVFRLASRCRENGGALPLHEMWQAWLDIRLRGFSPWRADLTIARHLRGAPNLNPSSPTTVPQSNETPVVPGTGGTSNQH
jgi:hypothetical protein